MKLISSIFFGAVLALFVASPTLAQDITYGLKAGLNVSNLDVSPELDPPAPSSRLGVHVGGFLELGLMDNVTFRPELTLSTQGANDEDIDVEQRVKLTYLNAALLFQYGLGNGIRIFAGPQIGILASGELEEEEKATGEQTIFDADNLYSGTDVALGLGVGYDLPNGLGFDLRYNLGLTDNNEDPLGVAFYEAGQEVQSRVVQISVNYKLGM